MNFYCVFLNFFSLLHQEIQRKTKSYDKTVILSIFVVDLKRNTAYFIYINFCSGRAVEECVNF
jgi:hypothetical protein